MQKPPDQQQYPSINANIVPDGMIITISIAPGFAFQQAIGSEMMDAICKQWRDTRKQTKDHLEIVRDMDVVRNINSKRGG